MFLLSALGYPWFRKFSRKVRGATEQKIAGSGASSASMPSSFSIPMPEQESQAQSQPINVYEALAIMAEQLASMAWQRMGLQHDMMTGKIEKDLDQAHAAVDATAALASIIEPTLEDDDRRTIQNLVRDLRMNYLQHTKGENS